MIENVPNRFRCLRIFANFFPNQTFPSSFPTFFILCTFYAFQRTLSLRSVQIALFKQLMVMSSAFRWLEHYLSLYVSLFMKREIEAPSRTFLPHNIRKAKEKAQQPTRLCALPCAPQMCGAAHVMEKQASKVETYFMNVTVDSMRNFL